MGPVLICTATRIEAKACWNGVKKSHLADRFEILQSGIGPLAAAKHLRLRLDHGERPSSIVSTGFTGSLSRRLEVGDWVWSDTVDATKISVPPSQILSSGLKWTKTQMHCLDHLDGLQSGFNRSGLAIETVDMESQAWAEAAVFEKIPYYVLRLVSDTPDLPIPKSLQSLFNDAGKLGFFKNLCHEPLKVARFCARSRALLPVLSDGWRCLADHWFSSH